MKYLNNAVIGNDKIVVSLDEKGRFLRMFFPTPDYRQHIEQIDVFFKIDGKIFNLNTLDNVVYNQNYEQNTNVVKTKIFLDEYNLEIEQTDFCVIDENVYTRRYNIKNNSDKKINISCIINSKSFANINNDTCGLFKEQSLIQYNKELTSCIYSNLKIQGARVNNNQQNPELEPLDNEYIGLSHGSTIFLENLSIDKNSNKDIFVNTLLIENKKIKALQDIDTEIIRMQKVDYVKKEQQAIKYWEKYVKKMTKINLSKLSDDAKKIYIRSLLLIDILINKETGGVSAAVEIDEYKEKSGRYSYCWPRDAYFVMEALNLINEKEQKELVEKYYSKFCKKTQNRQGNWEQRFYTDGSLAPCWGYQIDETALIILGAYKYYALVKNKNFLKQNLKMLEDGTKYLNKYIEDLNKKQNEKEIKIKTFDLWEMYQGETTFSLGAVYAAFDAMLNIYDQIYLEYENNRLKQEQIRKKIEQIKKNKMTVKQYIEDNFYSETRQSFVRGKEQEKIDISVLSLANMFNVFTPEDKKILKTIDNIEMNLRTFTGGYIRFEEDTYIEGNNPWIIANMMMCFYHLKAGNKDKVLENFNFIVNTATKNGFLAEQIDNETLEAKWVIGLTWVHGMYIVLINEMLKHGII